MAGQDQTGRNRRWIMFGRNSPRLTSSVLAFLLTIFFVGAAVAPAEEVVAAADRPVLLA